MPYTIDKNIRLRSPDQVIEFVKAVSVFDCSFDLHSGRILIDGKSLMGVMSLDLSKPIGLLAYAKSKEQMESIYNTIGKFMEEKE